jgi:small redox-active disulfide protein 2
MGPEDIFPIQIGNFQVGMVGLKDVMTELASSLGGASEEETAEALIQRLSKKNYIPEKSKPEYGRALVREFRKFLGQEVSSNRETQDLVIKVLGQGCSNCNVLTQRIMEILTELNLAADLEHVTDIKEIARYGAMLSPALVINGKIVARGTVPARAQLIKWFKKTGV